MSKLADAIRKTMHTEAAPIGFRAVRLAKTPSLLVAVVLDGDDRAKVAQALDKGAGAILLRNAGTDAVKAAAEVAGEVPLGAWPETVDAGAVAALVEAGADFLAFDAESTPATALLEDKLGYVLVLKDERDDTYLRVLESLALDAVFLDGWTGPLTLRKQLELRRIAALTRKPLMLPVSLPIESSGLECLRDAGISVVAVEGGDNALAELPALLSTIEALPGPRRRRETALEVLLPRAAEMAEEEEEEDDDEGE